MSLIRKFNFENGHHKCIVNIVKEGDDIWFKGRDVALALGYKNTQKAIKDHVHKNEKKIIKSWGTQNGGLGQNRSYMHINEPGLYRLIFESKLKSADKFKTWVFSVVLPSIRKTGVYQVTKGNQLMLMNEKDLHYQVIKYIHLYHPSAIIVPGLGEFQDTSSKRISGYRKGYKGGQPDIIILNKTLKHSGLAIELKTPNLTGKLSDKQKDFLNNLDEQGFKTIVSDDYDCLHRLIDEYFLNVRINCPYCCNKFCSKETLKTHKVGFHRIT